MLERGGGVIITVASYSVLSPGPPGGTAYSVSKAAVVALMKAINVEYRNRGIRACTIYPGEVDTAMLDARPLVPGAEDRASMMHADDMAQNHPALRPHAGPHAGRRHLRPPHPPAQHASRHRRRDGVLADAAGVIPAVGLSRG